MFDTWTTPTNDTRVPPGTYDLRLHVRKPDHGGYLTTFRVKVPGITTVSSLDAVLTQNFDQCPVRIIKIHDVPAAPADSVVLSTDDYALLKVMAEAWTESQRGSVRDRAIGQLGEINRRYS